MSEATLHLLENKVVDTIVVAIETVLQLAWFLFYSGAVALFFLALCTLIITVTMLVPLYVITEIIP